MLDFHAVTLCILCCLYILPILALPATPTPVDPELLRPIPSEALLARDVTPIRTPGRQNLEVISRVSLYDTGDLSGERPIVRERPSVWVLLGWRVKREWVKQRLEDSQGGEARDEGRRGTGHAGTQDEKDLSEEDDEEQSNANRDKVKLEM